MRGEHVVGAKENGGVLMPSHTSGDPSFYSKKRAKEAELGRELSTEDFLADHYAASEAATASGTSIFDPVLCEIAYRWFCPPDGMVLDPFAGGSVRGIVASRLGPAISASSFAANRSRPTRRARIRRATSAGVGPGRRAGHHDLPRISRPIWCLAARPMEPGSLFRRSVRSSTMGKEEFFAAYGEIIAAAAAS